MLTFNGWGSHIERDGARPLSCVFEVTDHFDLHAGQELMQQAG